MFDIGCGPAGTSPPTCPSSTTWFTLSPRFSALSISPTGTHSVNGVAQGHSYSLKTCALCCACAELRFVCTLFFILVWSSPLRTILRVIRMTAWRLFLMVRPDNCRTPKEGRSIVC
jgi:hypothetical protein